jgi:hypothetical protein
MRIFRLFTSVMGTLFCASFWIAYASSPDQTRVEQATRKNAVYVSNYESTRAFDLTAPPDGAMLSVSKITELPGNLSLGNTLNAYEQHRRDRRAASSAVPPGDVLWASISPDKKMAVVGYGDRGSMDETHVSVVDLSSAATAYPLRLLGEVSDVDWVVGTHTPLILESTQRMRKSPWGLLAAISGHPIEMKQYFLDIVDSKTHEIHRVILGAEVENAVGVFQ